METNFNKTNARESTFSRLPATFTIISWNLDGLDENHLPERTSAILNLLDKRKFMVIMFQELIPPTFQYIAAKLKAKYFPVIGTDRHDVGYFTATFLRINTAVYVDHYIVKFPGSAMDRNVLITRCQIGKIKLAICNTHLESTAAYASQRVVQLKTCFEHCRKFPPDWNVIFGGDLNARDNEVCGKIPSNMCDLWEMCGSHSSSKYTWDLTHNTNKQVPSKRQPRCRFDRIYYREFSPATLTPEFFGLTGFEKVVGTEMFPSDHWGVVAFFQVK